MSKITEKELDEIMALPRNADRVAVRVYEYSDQYIAKYDSKTVIAENEFLLDTELDKIGVPRKRNLFLMEGAL